MEKTVEFKKADLKMIANYLKDTYACEAGSLANDVMFQELEKIASDKHRLGACLANMFIDDDALKTVLYISSGDVGRPIPGGENKFIRITIDYIEDGEQEVHAPFSVGEITYSK